MELTLNTVNDYLLKNRMKNKQERALFIATCQVETMNFKRMVEMGYTPLRAIQVFPRYFSSLQDVKNVYTKYGSDGIFDRVYGKRYGNTEPRDGSKYKGRGVFGCTFKDNYQFAENVTGIPFVDKPELMADPENSLQFALHYWVNKGCGEAARQDDLYTALHDVRVLVNGGVNGLSDFSMYAKQNLKLIQ